MGIKQKKNFFLKKKSKMAVFQNRQFSTFFCENLMDWFLGY